MRPLVLLSNDDGVAAAGIRAMREALSSDADVIVVAPETEQSASSHSLSLHRPLRLRAVEAGVFAVDGTPADCVYIALHAATRVLPRKPDLVVSGINHGLNLGQDAFYSGTIAAAREGALRGIPALASSAHARVDLAVAAATSAAVALALLLEFQGSKPPEPRAGTAQALARREHPGRGALFNLNFPNAWNGALKATRLGARIYDEVVEFRVDPRGREYLWIGGPGVHHDPDPGTDTDAYDGGFASITPLALDLTYPPDEPLVESVLGRVTSKKS